MLSLLFNTHFAFDSVFETNDIDSTLDEALVNVSVLLLNFFDLIRKMPKVHVSDMIEVNLRYFICLCFASTIIHIYTSSRTD